MGKSGIGYHWGQRLDERCCVLSSSQSGLTPLLIAVFNAQAEAVKLLLEHGADAEATSNVSLCGIAPPAALRCMASCEGCRSSLQHLLPSMPCALAGRQRRVEPV